MTKDIRPVILTYHDDQGEEVISVFRAVTIDTTDASVLISAEKVHTVFSSIPSARIQAYSSALLNQATKIHDLEKELEELKKGIVTVDETNLEGAMLKELREVYGWSRSDIAEELGVSSEYVRLIERGDRKPSHPIRYKIRKLLR